MKFFCPRFICCFLLLWFAVAMSVSVQSALQADKGMMKHNHACRGSGRRRPGGQVPPENDDGNGGEGGAGDGGAGDGGAGDTETI